MHSEQEAIEYLATLATVQIASRAQMPNYTTMVQHFLGTLHLPMAIYMLDYYLPMLSLNDGYNETGSQCKVLARFGRNGNRSNCLTSIREANLANWKVTGGQDAFAFQHPSLTQTDVRELLDSEAHHHKVCPVGTGRLIAMVGITPTDDPSTRMLQVYLGWSSPSRPGCFWWFVFWFLLICHAACDHLCPCSCFLDGCFCLCKDRASERDRPYQEKKAKHPYVFKLEGFRLGTDVIADGSIHRFDAISQVYVLYRLCKTWNWSSVVKTHCAATDSKTCSKRISCHPVT